MKDNILKFRTVGGDWINLRVSTKDLEDLRELSTPLKIAALSRILLTTTTKEELQAFVEDESLPVSAHDVRAFASDLITMHETKDMLKKLSRKRG